MNHSVELLEVLLEGISEKEVEREQGPGNRV